MHPEALRLQAGYGYAHMGAAQESYARNAGPNAGVSAGVSVTFRLPRVQWVEVILCVYS
jgi:hypothetical protein